MMKNMWLIQALLCLAFIGAGSPRMAVAQTTEPELAPAPKAGSSKETYLNLYMGIEHHEKVVDLPTGATFSGDFRKYVKLEVSRQLQTMKFIPIKKGIGTLTVIDNKGRKLYDYRLDVKHSDLTKVAREIKALLSDIEGINIKVINNRVVVDGQILLPRDMNRIHSVVKQYEGQASTLVTLSPLAQKKIAQMIEADIENVEIRVRAINDKFILEGVAADEKERDRAYTIAQMYVPDVIVETAEADGVVKKIKRELVVNLIQVKPPGPKDPGKIVQLVVHFVELNKNYQNSFRFQWMPSIEDKSSVQFTNDSRTPGGLISTITGTVSNLLPKLNWAKSHGHARVLQSTSLIVLDGQKGDLRNVVRVPYPVYNAQGQASTNFEEAGLITSITPNILSARSDSVRLQMDFSLKSLLGITAQGPMVSNSAIQTVIIVRSGQSAAVGGLIANSAGTDYNKLPSGVSDNPIISLYASKSFQRNQSQFVVFVTPIIKSSASQGAEKIKKKFRLRD